MFNRGRGKCGIKEYRCIGFVVISINLDTHRDDSNHTGRKLNDIHVLTLNYVIINLFR